MKFKLDTPSLAQHPITVLMVDDSRLICAAVKKMLKDQQDITFHFCTDSHKAEEMAEQVKPTVILQDLIMPGINGLDMVRIFRSNPVTSQVPLIVLSAEEEPAIKAESFALGANDYMVKLPDAVEVIARIRYHSNSYINLLQRDEAFQALKESQERLEVRNRFIRETFGRYLSDDVVNSLLETPEGLNLGGEKRKVTIMMADLRGFTSLGERLAPEMVVKVINNYLEEMTSIIINYNGTIDEFIGDAILAIFGAPHRGNDDAERAVACAVEMQMAMQKVNLKNREQNLPEVKMGIGLNTGEVVVGNIGSEKRAKYGVVGSNVNLASRIESYTIGGQILISQSTKDEIGPILMVTKEMKVEPKGVKQPISIFNVGGIGGKYNLFISENQREPLKKLPNKVELLFSLCLGKDIDDRLFNGSISMLSLREAEIETEKKVEPMSNLKIKLLGQNGDPIPVDLYGKVIEVNDHPNRLLVHFTSIPLMAEAYFNGLLATCSSNEI